MPPVTDSGLDQCLLVLGTDSRRSRSAWLRAGEALERLWLEATRLDHVASLISQPVEVRQTRQRACAVELGLSIWPQVVLRVGQAAPNVATRRRDLDEVLEEPAPEPSTADPPTTTHDHQAPRRPARCAAAGQGAMIMTARHGFAVRPPGRGRTRRRRRLGRCPWTARRQGREPGGDDQAGHSRCPPGFTITTQACLAYLARRHGFPTSCGIRCVEALRAVETATGKEFGDPSRPLLVSCRSGAKFSMPGMMDTVLNIGLNDDTAKGLIALSHDEHFVFDSYRRLIQMFGTVVLGLRDELFENVLASGAHRPGRRQRRRSDRRRSAGGRPTSSATSPRSSRSIPTSSCGWRSKRSSPPGTGAEPSTTAPPPRSRTTWAPRSTSRRWCSATWATAPPPGSR